MAQLANIAQPSQPTTLRPTSGIISVPCSRCSVMVKPRAGSAVSSTRPLGGSIQAFRLRGRPPGPGGPAADRHHRIARLLRQAELGERGAAGEGRLGCDSVDLRRPLGPSRDRIAGGLQGPVEAVMPHEQGARDAERRQDAQQAHADPEVRLEPEAAKAGGERARHADILAKLPSR